MSTVAPHGLLQQGTGVLGQTQRMAPGSVEADLLRISAHNPCDPRVVTVAISKRLVNDAAVATDHRVQIRARFGTGASTHTLLFDARNGALITLPANALYLTTLYLGATGPTVDVGAAVAYGSRPGADTAVTFTEAAITVAAGGVGPAPVLRIPDHAVRVAWTSPDDPLGVPPPQATIQLAGEPTFGAVEQQQAPDAGEFFTIAAGMQYARLRNDGANGDYQLVYELGL